MLCWLAIVPPAMVFGLTHLLAGAMTLGGLDAAVAVFIVAANTLAGIGFGWLYRRHGLEMILVHALAHIVNCVFGAA